MTWPGVIILASVFWPIPIGIIPYFLDRYRDYFSTNYIAELFCQLAWVQDYVDCRSIALPAVDPDFDVPDILIHCTTARAAKVWPFRHWRSVLDDLQSPRLECGVGW